MVGYHAVNDGLWAQGNRRPTSQAGWSARKHRQSKVVSAPTTVAQWQLWVANGRSTRTALGRFRAIDLVTILGERLSFQVPDRHIRAPLSRYWFSIATADNNQDKVFSDR